MTTMTESAGVAMPDNAPDVLNCEQLGHLRHIDNLSRQLQNDWSFMLTKPTGQFDFGGYRFQMAYMTYAMALSHRHRLPNAPGVFKPAFERFMDKMLLPDVWDYWRDVSRGGAVFNAHLSHDYTEQWDPVVKDNIMFSAYVQSMATLYHHLFDDDRYTRPGSLTFEYWSFFWGDREGHKFEYDENSLNEHIYWLMVQSGYLGVACEPNCSFQICNQPAILGFRMHDLVAGTNIAEEVTTEFNKVWSELGEQGMLDANGHYPMMTLQDSMTTLPNPGAAFVDAWNGTLMNMWNRDFVHEHYPKQIQSVLVDGPDGTKSIAIPPQIELGGQSPENDTCDFGWACTWSSEMGDSSTLDALLAHADRFMSPTWHNGGLYYPRNDERYDDEGNITLMEPLSGNALIGYARLNVPDGLWKLYNQPWGAEHHTEPMLSGVSPDVAVSQARFNTATSVLTFRVQRHDDRKGDGTIVLDNVASLPQWSLRSEGVEVSNEQTQSRLGGTIVTRTEQGIELRLEPGEPRVFELHIG